MHPSRFITIGLPGRASCLAVAAILCACGLGGCTEFKPLSLNQGDNPAAKPADPKPGGDDLSDLVFKQVTDNVSRLEQASPKTDRGKIKSAGGPHMPDATGQSSPEGPVEVLGVSDPPEVAGGIRLPRKDGAAATGNTTGQPAVTASRPRPAAPAGSADNSERPPVVRTAGPMIGIGGADPNNHDATPGAGANMAVGGENSPAGSQTPSQTLALAITQAEKVAANQPTDFRLQLQLRMLYLAAGRTREAQTVWPAGSAADQKTLSAWIEAGIALEASKSAAAAGQADPHEATLAAIERLRQQLAEHATLKIRSVRLANRVDGFGILTPLDGDVVRPGQWVIVYSELENLTSRLDTDGLHRSEFGLRVEVLSAEGKSLLCQEDKQVVDRSLNQRRDFFLARRTHMPTELPAGQYVLRVSVEDRTAAKVGESMLRFQVK